MIFAFLFSFFPAFAENDWAVRSSQFQHGSYWIWKHSELNENQWSPYLYERYTVTQVHGSKLTIEMSSSPQAVSVTDAHHKFIIDFKNCEAAAKDPKKGTFKVEFYTKSLTRSWSLVSKTHPNLVFIEKFNCLNDSPNSALVDSVNFHGQSEAIFQWPSASFQEVSWYFASHPQLKGVASGKVFQPSLRYKMELVDFN